MNGDKINLEKILVCPACRSDLLKRKDKLFCPVCRKNYLLKEGIPILTENLSPQNLKQVNYFSQARNVTTAPYFLEEWQKSFLGRLRESLPEVQGKVILDGGVGQGYMSIELAKKGAIVIACDLSFPALLRLKKIAVKEEVEKRIVFVCCSLQKLPIKKATADGIIINAVLEHLADEEGALKEIDRVAKRRSVLMVTTPLKLRYLFPLFIPSSIWQDRMIGHLRRYDEPTLMRLFRKFRFKKNKSYYSGHLLKVIFTKLILPLFRFEYLTEKVEMLDRRQEQNKLWASNVCVIFRRRNE